MMKYLSFGLIMGAVMLIVLQAFLLQVEPCQIAFDGMQVAGKMVSAGIRYIREHYHQKSFEDVPPEYWAFEEIELIHSYGITVGCSYDPPLYCPDRPMTRAEAAVFAARLIELMGGEK